MALTLRVRSAHGVFLAYDTPSTLLVLMDGLCHLTVWGDDQDLPFAADDGAPRGTNGVSVDVPDTAAAVDIRISAAAEGKVGGVDAMQPSGGGAPERHQDGVVDGESVRSPASCTVPTSTKREGPTSKIDRKL